MRLFFALLATLFIACPAFAEVGPRETLQGIVTQMKAKGSLLPILDHVDWQHAYEKMTPSHRAQIKVNTPAELQKFYTNLFSDPAKLLKARLEGQMASVPPEHRGMVEQQMTQILAGVNAKMAEQNEKLKRTEYKIGEATIDGNKATVPVTSSIDGKSKSDMVTLVKKEDKWLLPSLEMVKGEAEGPGAPGAPGAPAKAAPPVAAP